MPQSEISNLTYNLPKVVNENGGLTRIFIPKYGNINERRHQLHEVIRLSGMNLIINDMDMPLIIKVASIPKERMQVYFIDNDEYFKRKAVFTDEDDQLFSDNDERAIFFAKGVIETVKKLNWAPDIIHVHGWMASLLPLYLKKYYGEEPLFAESKIVTSIYDNGFEGVLNKELLDKLKFDKLDESIISSLETPTYPNIIKCAIDNSDAIVQGSDSLPEELQDYINGSSTHQLSFHHEDSFDPYLNFYKELISQE